MCFYELKWLLRNQHFVEYFILYNVLQKIKLYLGLLEKAANRWSLIFNDIIILCILLYYYNMQYEVAI